MRLGFSLAIVALFAQPCFAASVAGLEGGQRLPTGYYAIASPPVEQDEAKQLDKDVVVVSAPREKWIVSSGADDDVQASALAGRQCDQRLRALRETAASRVLEVKRDMLDRPETMALMRYNEKKGMSADDALAKTLDDLSAPWLVKKIQADYAKCEESDGSALFRLPLKAVPSPEADRIR